MKVLIVHSGTIGETLLITPIIRHLTTEKDAEVHLAIPKKRHAILSENPYLQKILNLNEGLFTLRKKIKVENYTAIIDLQNNSRSFALRFLNGTKNLIFKKNSLKKWLYKTTKINLLPSTHIVDQYMELLRPLEIKRDSLGLDFYIPEKDEVENEWLPESHQTGYAVLAVGARYNTRKLPVNRLIELCDRINKPIILIGSEEERSITTEVDSFFEPGTPEEEEAIEGLNKKTITFNACGKFNFNQQASLIKNASWVFTYDNDFMHVAAAFKKQIFSIWGNTSPHFGMYPYRTQFTVFENNKLGCRPCTSKGYANCPKGHFKCMNDVSFDFYLPD